MPSWSTSFVGRTRELVRLGGDLTTHRLVTLVGPGGSGKSRLAAEVARCAAGERHDRVWWVDLAPLPIGSPVAPAVLAALGLVDSAGRADTDHLSGFLDHRDTMLVLDNCEHVTAAAAPLIAELLGRCPAVVVLATSRTRLGIPGELVREVGPLDLPDATGPGPQGPHAPAVTLFLDRARAARPDVGTDLADVVEICRLVEGMPLAIELAAAQAATLTTSQIRAGLVAGLRPSAIAPWALPDRHRTLETCIRWSADLLPGHARLLLARLSVFAGEFDGAAAAEVCADDALPADDVAAALTTLAEHSLLQGTHLAGAGRHRMLEAVRRFAWSDLLDAADREELHERHLSRAVRVAARIESALIGANATVIDTLARELDDLRAALKHALGEPDPEPALRVAAAAGFLLVHRGRYREAVSMTGAALARPGGPARIRAQAALMAAFAAFGLGDDPTVAAAARECWRLADADPDPALHARAHLLTGWTSFSDPPDATVPHLIEALRYAEAAGDVWVQLEVLVEFALQAVRADDHAAAVAWLDRCVPQARALGNDYMLAWGLLLLGICRLRQGELLAARRDAVEAWECAQSASVREIYADYVLAQVELASGRPAEAARVADRALRAAEESGTHQGVGTVRSWRAQAGIELSEPGAAEILASAVLGIDPEADPWEYCPAALNLARHRANTGDPVGAAGPLAQAARTGAKLGGPWVAANVALLEGLLLLDDDSDAAGRVHEALRLAQEHGFGLVALDGLDLLAILAARGGRCVEAARVLATVDHRRAVLGAPRGLTDRGRYDATLALIAAEPDRAAVAAAHSQGTELTLPQLLVWVRRGRGVRSRDVGWSGLTPAERDVASLAAQGLSNSAIAARLFVAPGTVKTHLGRIYAKLGVANRTELAARVSRSVDV